MKKEYLNFFDFSDSEFIDFELKKDKSLIVTLKSWEEKIFLIKFANTIQLSYKLGFQISNLYELTEKTNFLEEALSRKYESPYPPNQFREFNFLDLDDFPFIQIIADSVELLK